MSHAAALAEKLVADVYGELFYYPQHDETIAKIWNEPSNAAALEALDDPKAPAKARFVAAEALFARDLTFIGRHDLGVVARIYAIALQRKLTGHLNAWGLVWYSDSAGPVGNRFIAIGKAVDISAARKPPSATARSFASATSPHTTCRRLSTSHSPSRRSLR
jgi:hypothetical protein